MPCSVSLSAVGFAEQRASLHHSGQAEMTGSFARRWRIEPCNNISVTSAELTE